MEITLDRKGVEPGAPIEGTIRHADAGVVSLRLWWETKGKGDRDEGVVELKAIPTSGRTTRFAITAPHTPVSFSGTLISVIYKLRATAGTEQAEVEVVVAPGGEEVILAPAR